MNGPSKRSYRVNITLCAYGSDCFRNFYLSSLDCAPPIPAARLVVGSPRTQPHSTALVCMSTAVVS